MRTAGTLAISIVSQRPTECRLRQRILTEPTDCVTDQIYAGTYRFDVNGGTTAMPTHDATGAVPFHWQPSANVWTYLSVTYSTENKYIKLWVNSQFVETIDCQTCTVPVTLDSPRIGSWLDPSSTVARSLHGEISVFRVWNTESTGVDVCPSAQTEGLIAQYVFGESGDTAHDTSGNENDGIIHNADWSNELPPSQQCQRQGFGGFFDGDADFVSVPDLGTFPEIQADVWLKFEQIVECDGCPEGRHPVMVEDGWDAGTIHLQIIDGLFVLGINGVGDYKFGWQPQAGIWYFTSLRFATTTPRNSARFGDAPRLMLSVDNTLVDDAKESMGGSFTYTTGTWANADGSGIDCPCTLPPLQPLHFHSMRLGAYASSGSNPNGFTGPDVTIDRSMRGQLAVFRLWDRMRSGEDRCPSSGDAGLVVNYLFDSLSSTLKDRSGNGHDATIHDTKYSADYPDLSCIFHRSQMWKVRCALSICVHA